MAKKQLSSRLLILLAVILSFVCMSSLAFADGYRVVVKKPGGKEICEYGDDYVDCKYANLRYETRIDGQDVSCLYEDFQYTDCVPYEDRTSVDWVMNHSEDYDPHYFRPYRIVVRDENGLQVCEIGADYKNCTTANLRHTSIIGGETMSCVYEGGEEVDCLPYEDHYSMEWVINHRDESQEQNNTQSSAMQSSGQSSSQNAYVSSSYVSNYREPDYWENDYAIPNGFTWGIALGWFGLVEHGDLADNSFSFGADIGGKWTHFGFSLDCDLSINIINEPYHDLWTYSFHGMFMMFFPFDYGKEQTIGLGLGYTGWALDYDNPEKLNYRWYNDVYYVENDNPEKVIDSGGFLSLKLKARLDFVFDETTIGFEFDWIPWLDIKHGGKLVNHIVGLQFHLGGIE